MKSLVSNKSKISTQDVPRRRGRERKKGLKKERKKEPKTKGRSTKMIVKSRAIEIEVERERG